MLLPISGQFLSEVGMSLKFCTFLSFFLINTVFAGGFDPLKGKVLLECRADEDRVQLKLQGHRLYFYRPDSKVIDVQQIVGPHSVQVYGSDPDNFNITKYYLSPVLPISIIIGFTGIEKSWDFYASERSVRTVTNYRVWAEDFTSTIRNYSDCVGDFEQIIDDLRVH